MPRVLTIMIMVYIKPTSAILARTPTYLKESLLNRKSTGFGYRMDRTSSPFAVENPESEYKLINPRR